jgi:nicotinamide-nucleotide adenylyltransferase
MKKYKTGLFIGRFQPFHKGHLYIIKKVLKRVDKLIIGIGSAQVINKDNPLSVKLRKKMLEIVIEEEGWGDRITSIILLRDYPDDDFWLKKVLQKTGKPDIIIGNNEWVNGIFKRAGFAVLRPGFYKRCLYEGVKIRKLISEGKKWKDRVPKYLIPKLCVNLTHERTIY